MISLEQVKLLESKVSRALEYTKRVNEENAKLKEKLDSYEKRTNELEVLFQRFKEDQNRIEEGILSALGLLNQFEDAVESKLSREPVPSEIQSKASPKRESRHGKPKNHDAETGIHETAELSDEELLVAVETEEEIPEEDSDGIYEEEKNSEKTDVGGTELDIF